MSQRIHKRLPELVERRAAKRGGLVLTRRFGERIEMTLPNGEEISITALESRNARSSIRVQIAAPATVRIRRDELDLVDELRDGQSAA